MEQGLVPWPILEFKDHRVYGMRYRDGHEGAVGAIYAEWSFAVAKDHVLTRADADRIIARFSACVNGEVKA